MWKFPLTLFLTAVSTISVPESEIKCQLNYHHVCGNSGNITSVKARKCEESMWCGAGGGNPYICKEYCEDQITIHMHNVTEIAPHAFQTANSFTKLRLISESKKCGQKMVTLTPESFHGLSSLRILNLHCLNFTSALNPFKNLEPIQNLVISRIELMDLPQPFFSDFPKLRKLRLTKLKIDTITPHLFSQINSGLRYLALKFNKLRVIEGRSFRKFNRLTQLVITENLLTDLQPDMFYDLKELTSLDLSSNNITVLRRKTFGTLPKLETLNLPSNKIHAIKAEAFSGLPIQHLNLESNRLMNWTAGAFKNLPNLSSLKMMANEITILCPGAFKGLKNNRLDIDLADNKIQHIQPNTFRGINLNSLNLVGNSLSILENDIFNGLRIYNWLDLGDNEIIEIKENAFRNLNSMQHQSNETNFSSKEAFDVLTLSHNQIRHIEPNAFRGFNLRRLPLNNNDLQLLEEDTFNGLYIKGSLDLSENNITEIRKNAFRNLMVRGSIILRCNNITNVNYKTCGVNESSIADIDFDKDPCP